MGKIICKVEYSLKWWCLNSSPSYNLSFLAINHNICKFRFVNLHVYTILLHKKPDETMLEGAAQIKAYEILIRNGIWYCGTFTFTDQFLKLDLWRRRQQLLICKGLLKKISNTRSLHIQLPPFQEHRNAENLLLTIRLLCILLLFCHRSYSLAKPGPAWTSLVILWDSGP